MPEIVQEIGAYAGLASVIGLAVLSALYFSQARDVRRLREWAGRAPERADELPGAQTPVPGRVVAQPQAKAQPGPPAVPRAATPAGAKPATPLPGKPATGVPAVPAGTTPATAKPATPSPGAPAPVPAAGAAAAAVAAAAGARASEARATPGSAQQGAGVATPDAPKDPAAAERPAGANEPASPNGPATADEPATADKPGAADEPAAADEPTAGDGSATAHKPAPADEPATADRPDAPEGPSAPGAQPAARPGVPQPATAAGSRAPAVPPVPPAAPRPGVRPRPTPQQTEVIPPRREPWHQRLFGGTRNLLLAIAGVLVLGVGVAFALSQTSGEDGGSANSSQQGSGSSAQAGGDGNGGDSGGDGGDDGGDGGGTKRKPIEPSTVTVAVLNGTMVPGLAAGVGTDVSEAGFGLGTVANDETEGEQRAESVILYAQGNEREALAVGRKLGITQRQKIDPDTQALAGDAGVVVVVGQDRAP